MNFFEWIDHRELKLEIGGDYKNREVHAQVNVAYFEQRELILCRFTLPLGVKSATDHCYEALILLERSMRNDYKKLVFLHRPIEHLHGSPWTPLTMDEVIEFKPKITIL